MAHNFVADKATLDAVKVDTSAIITAMSAGSSTENLIAQASIYSGEKYINLWSLREKFDALMAARTHDLWREEGLFDAFVVAEYPWCNLIGKFCNDNDMSKWQFTVVGDMLSDTYCITKIANSIKAIAFIAYHSIAGRSIFDNPGNLLLGPDLLVSFLFIKSFNSGFDYGSLCTYLETRRTELIQVSNLAKSKGYLLDFSRSGQGYDNWTTWNLIGIIISGNTSSYSSYGSQINITSGTYAKVYSGVNVAFTCTFIGNLIEVSAYSWANSTGYILNKKIERFFDKLNPSFAKGATIINHPGVTNVVIDSYLVEPISTYTRNTTDATKASHVELATPGSLNVYGITGNKVYWEVKKV